MQIADVGLGIPQSSKPGPLLFFLYINDLNDCISEKIAAPPGGRVPFFAVYTV